MYIGTEGPEALGGVGRHFAGLMIITRGPEALGGIGSSQQASRS